MLSTSSLEHGVRILVTISRDGDRGLNPLMDFAGFKPEYVRIFNPNLTKPVPKGWINPR